MILEKIVEFSPAYDKRHPEPSKNYGIGGVQIRFVLKGKEGAVQLLLGTSWYLPHVAEWLREKGSRFEKLYEPPKGWDLGYHSPKPIYEDQSLAVDSCPYLNGKPCYYDGSGLAADPIRDRLISEGSEAVWEELTDYYNGRFGTSYNTHERRTPE